MSKTAIEDILAFLDKHPKQVYKARELAKRLRVNNQAYQAFKRTVHELAMEGKISRHKGNRYGTMRKPSLVSGVLHVKTQGYGFVLRDDGGEDIFISQKNMGSAVHRDRVSVRIWAQPVGRLAEGKVVEVLERERDRIVGMFREGSAYAYVVPDDLKLTRDVYVGDENRGDARTGQKVVVVIGSWGDSRRLPEGRVVEILGDADDPGVDVLSIIHTYRLPTRFPGAVEEEVRALPPAIPDALLEGRLDLREKIVFTIDPADAKDFDDAVSVERLAGGNLLLGVHIADVDAFVPAGSAVDREALRRGTSVYLVDRAIPMLPERLSGDLCSLRPGEDRLTFSVMMEVTQDGSVVDYDIRESIIKSRHRLTYEEAQAWIDRVTARADSKNHPTDDEDAELFSAFRDMVRLERGLWARWGGAGTIDFDMPEADVIFDENGGVEDIRVKTRLESHRLIEAFMLLTNRTVAEHVARLRREEGRRFPFVYRIHERPSGEKLESFARFVKAMGYAFDAGKRVRPRMFQDLLESVKGTDHEVVIETVALRTMMKARYTTKNVGHFGLAFPHYTHFTSPIRRYPDLTVHRLLKAYGASGHPAELAAPLADICETSTACEIRAQEAEWESLKAKQVRFMADRLGEMFTGVVSGVTSFGFFVEIPESLVEGLVHVKDLEDDYYVHDEVHYCLVGQRSGRTYRLGDRVRVQVARVSMEMRKIDFILV